MFSGNHGRRRGIMILIILTVFVLYSISPKLQIHNYYTGLTDNNTGLLRSQQVHNGQAITSRKGHYILHRWKDTAYSGFDVTKAKLNFLPNFKSHCWVENYTGEDVYINNTYRLYDDYPFYGAYGKRLGNFPPGGVNIRLNYGVCHTQPSGCRLRCLPHFMLIGVAKSGTTDLSARLRRHPEVYGATAKELYWWTQFRFTLLGATLGDYADLFDGGTRKLTTTNIDTSHNKVYYRTALGEFTSMTFFDFSHWREDPKNANQKEPHNTVANDIHAVLPNVKLIVILRNPTTRLYSSYNMFTPKSKRSGEDFHRRVVGSIWWWNTCVKRLPARNCASGSPPEMPPVYDSLGNRRQWWRRDRNYTGEIRHGMYGLFIHDWVKLFPRENMLFIRTEDYSKNLTNAYNNVIFPFLKLSKLQNQRKTRHIKKMKVFGKRRYSPMLAKTKVLLDRFYGPFNKQLAKVLGDNKWLWNGDQVKVID